MSHTKWATQVRHGKNIHMYYGAFTTNVMPVFGPELKFFELKKKYLHLMKLTSVEIRSDVVDETFVAVCGKHTLSLASVSTTALWVSRRKWKWRIFAGFVSLGN